MEKKTRKQHTKKADKRPQSTTTQSVRLTDNEIIRRIFPRGLDKNKVWNDFIVPLTSPNQRRSERLDSLIDRGFHLQERIQKCFPTDADLLLLIESGDVTALQRMTERTWKFGRNHAQYYQKVIVLVGNTRSEIILHLAVNIVIAAMLKQAKPDIFNDLVQ